MKGCTAERATARMSQFIKDLVRPYVVDTSLGDGYRAMASDKAREGEAMK